MDIIPLPYRLLAIAVFAAASFGAGFYTKAKFDKAAQVVVAEQRVEDVQKSAVEARMTDREIDKATGSINDRNEEIKKEIKRAPIIVYRQPAPAVAQAHLVIPPSLAPTAVVEPTTQLACPEPLLSADAVRLLNRARLDQDPAVGSNAAIEPTADVGLPELVDNDLEVVKRYHLLAKRHDALVDWVDNNLGAPQ